jgi:hypothetical protein
MINSFARVRPFDIARIERSRWSAWITSVLANQLSRVRLVGSEELLINTLFVWLATLHVVAALRGAAPTADRVRDDACAIEAPALSRPILPTGGTRAEPQVTRRAR